MNKDEMNQPMLNTNKAQDLLVFKAKWLVAYLLLSMVVLWVSITIFTILFNSGGIGQMLSKLVLAYLIMNIAKDKIMLEVDRMLKKVR
jgi:hypothetical protein